MSMTEEDEVSSDKEGVDESLSVEGRCLAMAEEDGSSASEDVQIALQHLLCIHKCNDREILDARHRRILLSVCVESWQEKERRLLVGQCVAFPDIWL